MTLLMTEGFDHQSIGADLAHQFTVVTGAKAFVPGRFGGRAVSLANSNGAPNGSRLCYSPTNLSSGTLGFGFQISAPPSPSTQAASSLYLYFGNTANANLISVQLNGATGIATATTAVALGTAGVSQGAVFSAGLWNFCEIQAVIHPTNGAITVQINGVNALSVSGVKTTAASSVLSLINWCFGNAGTCYIDDVYFCDLNGTAPFNTFLGGCHINTLFPSAPGTYTQFTPNNPNNSNWMGASDPILDGDMTYNTASNVGTKDTFVSAAAFLPAVTILAVQPKSAVRQDDTVARQMQTYLKSGSTELGGAPYQMTQSYNFMTDLYINDPATGLPWTSAGVNALEFGYNIVE